MKGIFKIVASVLVIAVLFIALITGIFLAIFDANEYKQEAIDLVREETGRELQFYGEVNLTVFPALGMELGGMSFSNSPGFGMTDMFKVDKASISVDVASLFAFNPQVNQLVLDGLEINLQKNIKGVTNWDDLVTTAESASTGSGTSSASNDGSPNEDASQIKGSFGGLVINNARVLWQDAQAGVEYRIDDLDINTGKITPDKPFDLQLHLALQSKDEAAAKIDLEGKIQFLAQQSLLRIDQLKVQVEAEGSLIPLEKLEAGLESDVMLLDLQGNALKLEGLTVSLGESQLTGMFEVSDFTRPALNFKLASDKLDIDALLGTPSVAQKAEQSAAQPDTGTGQPAAAEDVQISLPMELLRSMQVDGELLVKQIKIENLLLNEVELKIKVDEGQVNLDPIKINLYEGNFLGGIRVDARGKLPAYRIREKLAGVQVGQLLTDYMGEDRISGKMDANASIATHGEWLSALKKNSNGKLDIALKNGALKGFNLRYSIDRVKAKLNNEPDPPEQPLQTDFTSLTMSGLIKKGIFSSNDLNMQAPLLRVGGEGIANINNDTVDYRVDAKLVGTIDGQQGGEADELKGLLIPVRIVGPFDSPSIDVQLDELLKANAAQLRGEKEAELKAKLEQAKEQEKQKAEDKLKEKLKNLF